MFAGWHQDLLSDPKGLYESLKVVRFGLKIPSLGYLFSITRLASDAEQLYQAMEF